MQDLPQFLRSGNTYGVFFNKIRFYAQFSIFGNNNSNTNKCKLIEINTFAYFFVQVNHFGAQSKTLSMHCLDSNLNVLRFETNAFLQRNILSIICSHK